MLDMFVGILLGILLHRAYIHIRVQMLEKQIEQKIDNVLAEFRSSVIDSKIEFVDGVYYMYDRHTNEFLAQGKTFEELEKAAKTKRPDKLFNVPHEELMSIIKEKNEKK